jgi:hypothetical protein
MKNTTITQIMNQIIIAEKELEMHQAIVNSLTQKLETSQLFLQNAEANKTQTLANKNSMEALVQSTLNVMTNTEDTKKEILKTQIKTTKVSQEIKNTVNQLIYSTQIINKLSQTVLRKKALNPLISDDLIAKILVATTDANNAIALTLVALKSAFTVQSTINQTAATITLAQKHAVELYSTLTGTILSDDKTITSKTPSNPLHMLIENAYEIAVLYLDNALKSNAETAQQLNVSQANLYKTQQILKSLQSGLAAAQQI